MTYVFLVDLVGKKKENYHQHPFFAIFFARAKTKINKKNNPKTTNWLQKVVQMTKGAISNHIFFIKKVYILTWTFFLGLVVSGRFSAPRLHKYSLT